MPPRKSTQRPPASRPAAQSPPRQTQPDLEIVDPVWLLKALGLMLIAAIICAWLALCLLYYQGSWQLVLRPTHTVDRTPAQLGIPFEEVRFDAEQTGQPRLTGWWIPAVASSAPADLQARPKYAADTILFLHDGTGSLSAALPSLALPHSFGTNVFALDYRGYGHSEAAGHPTSESMKQDSAAALEYLTGTRHLPPDRIVVYGVGLGAALAVSLAKDHGELPAVILDNPNPDPVRTAIAAHPSGIVPILWLYHEHFEIASPLSFLPTPKLLISGGPNAALSPDKGASLQALFRSAHDPALSVALPTTGYEQMYKEAISRFLDQYLPSGPSAR